MAEPGHGAMHGGHHHAVWGADTLLLTILPALALLLYLWAARRPGPHRSWNPWRSASFALGIALVVAAVAPPVAAWAHADLRGHMVQHLALGMFAPLGLVFGAPVTLALRTLPARTAAALMRLLRSVPIRFVTYPATAACLNLLPMAALYLTPLYAASLQNGALHLWLHVHFLVAGCLFAWAIAGPDPAPHRPGPALRLAVLICHAAGHAILGKLMYGYHFPRGTGATAAEIEAAAQWMYYGGDIAELLLAIALFHGWFAARDRAFRRDRCLAEAPS
ncbi:cytochrome c oxidase assembly protein [Plastorhodobacter daqingensis]|uniref:Cytochrome c oxidase assembly protein n=1 Tax=Plastorhodobacter daqingensis TaxID=1387281 RepID=A0ABW2UML6_9RHOB